MVRVMHGRALGFLVLVGVAVASACGSSDGKKASRTDYAAGEAGMASGAGTGTSSSTGGESDGAPTTGVGGDDTGVGGAQGEGGIGTGTLGAAGNATTGSGDSAGAAGAAGSGSQTSEPTLVWTDGFENGFGDWSVEGGVWTIGTPTFAGAPKPYDGVAYAGMGLAGNYIGAHDARLVSPSFEVPALAEHPRFKYAYWYSFGVNGGNVDYGQVQVRVKGGNWVDLADDRLSSASDHWSQRVIELDDYAGQTIQIGFHTVLTGTAPHPGWFIDTVSLEKGAVDFAGGFDDDLGDWSAQGGLWTFGAPARVGAPAPFFGKGYAGTSLSVTYSGAHLSRLVSPPFVVPAADELPRLRYQDYYNFGVNGGFIDSGQVQLRVDGEDWQDLKGERITVRGDNWSQGLLDLRAFAGQRVRVAFLAKTTGAATNEGWFVDDVKLETGPLKLAAVEGFENGFGDWSVQGGVWAIGAPTNAAGPTAYAGSGVAGTNLKVNYGGAQDARLVSPEFTVPAADTNPRFKYLYWYSLGHNGGIIDYGQLQIRSAGGDWVDVAGEKITDSSNQWSQRIVDLSGYAGQPIQIGFHLVTWGAAPAPGWFIDNASLVHD